VTSKKSIFEKLGLVEAVEETVEGVDNNSEGFFLNPNDEELSVEFDAMRRGQEPTAMQADEMAFETVSEEMTHLEPVVDNQFTDNQTNVEESSFEIEDKLNVLIGAYEKNKMLSIDDIYRNARLAGDSKRSIFIADIFLKTLPENLPVDIKRTSLLNILGVSNISIEELLTDAFQRIDSLNTVLENTVNTTDDILKKNEMSIKELENRIEELRNINEIRRKFQEDQNTLIEYEIQRIINIVDFIKPKK
jgi:hypothetical protein